ncbi:MAG TPA: hypothetical protein EYP49_10240 [Anaerolineae bacterium]|nr:hypothetical protein [Anaerolineae bacterium]
MTVTTPLQDLRRLERFYNAGFHNRFLDVALRKIVSHQIERDEADLARVEAVLGEFEQRYDLSSTDFWQRYQAGQMPDEADFVEWNAFCKMRQRLVERLHILRGDQADA